jgi:hypothetical protein
VSAGADKKVAALAKSYWPWAKSYLSDGRGLVGFRTGPEGSGDVIVWCKPGNQPGMWVETGSTLTSEGAEKVVF